MLYSYVSLYENLMRLSDETGEREWKEEEKEKEERTDRTDEALHVLACCTYSAISDLSVELVAFPAISILCHI